MRVRAMSHGGIILSIETPDRDGRMRDVTLGHDTPADYAVNRPYFGALIGRYANRIAGASFVLEGRTWELARNDGPNSLHGGRRGFDQADWSIAPLADGGAGAGVRLGHRSPDGDEGYPGNLAVEVTYRLTDRNTLILEYAATTDRPTPVNFTQHSYFNLAGDPGVDVLDHQLTIPAARYTPVDAGLIPTGELAAVAGTPFDFRSPIAIGARIAASNAQLAYAGGYDHNFVLDRDGPGLVHAAHVHHPASGRTLDVYTTEPGVQLYSGNHLDGSVTGKGGVPARRHHGFCLETQHFPDSPHQPSFPSTILVPGATWRSRSTYTFGIN